MSRETRRHGDTILADVRTIPTRTDRQIRDAATALVPPLQM